MTHLKTFFVTLNIQCGQYEKANKYLVTAVDADLAQDYAIMLEAQEPKELDWGHNGATDMGCEFGYSYGTCVEVKPDDVPVLTTYLNHFTAWRSELKESGNWLDTQE